jgi:beta-glucuronidase
MLTNWNFKGREGRVIDQDWGLLPDPMGRCRRQTWWKSERVPGKFFPSYDEDAFWPTAVPGSFVRCHPELAYYEGEVVYRVHFDVAPEKVGERTFLDFECVCDRGAAYLNGRLVGEFDGPHQAYVADVTGIVQEHNRLLVLVDNRRRATDVPGEIHDWFHEGGLMGPVTIYHLPRVCIRETRVQTVLTDKNEVELTLQAIVDAPSRDRAVPTTFTLLDPRTDMEVVSRSVALRPGAWGGAGAAISRGDVQLWSPDNPFRYTLRVTMEGDCWKESVGLREIRCEGATIRLNGNPIVLKGVCGYLDSACGNYPRTPEVAERMLDTVQDLGCNFVRAGHVPPSPALIDACDRRGLVVWAEVPAYWLPNMHMPPARHRALGMLEGMIHKHRNAASVIIWSVGNECVYHDPESGQSNLTYFLEAADRARELDPTRLVSYTGGFEGSGNPHLAKICPPALVESLDVLGYNSYSGIEDGAIPGKPPEFDQHWDKLKAASAFGKPVILAEVGIDAVRGEQGFDYGEARQAEYFRKVMEFFRQATDQGLLQGMTIFTLSDFKTPIKLGRFQAGYNRKGIQTADGQPKMAYRIVQEGYGGKM